MAHRPSKAGGEDDDPEAVSSYLSCVYFGVEALRADIEDQAPKEVHVDEAQSVLADTSIWSQKEREKRGMDEQTEETPYSIACEAHFLLLAKTYLLADKLRDLTTANLVIDEYIRFSQTMRRNPDTQVVKHVYESTVHGSPLRRLMRDYTVHETSSHAYLDFHTTKWPEEFCRDILVEFLRAQDGNPIEAFKCKQALGLPQKLCADRCHYHLHEGPGCVTERSAGFCACAKP
jgi:hypothetical protein